MELNYFSVTSILHILHHLFVSDVFKIQSDGAQSRKDIKTTFKLMRCVFVLLETKRFTPD